MSVAGNLRGANKLKKNSVVIECVKKNYIYNTYIFYDDSNN